MRRVLTTVRAGLAAAACVLLVGRAAGQNAAVLSRLNSDPTVRGTQQSKSYRVLFDAFLELDDPPFAVGDDFNLRTIHPGMSQWSLVSDWAESGRHMADAINSSRDRNILGLPYGVDEVDSVYRQAGLVAAIAVEGDLHRNEFRYLEPVDVMSAYATAEIYRRLEAKQFAEALELAVSFNWMLRQLCDRVFYAEKWHSIQLLIDALANLRDMLYSYRQLITADQFAELARNDLPALRPGRGRLLIPEGDRIIAEALLEEVFDNQSQADPEKFARSFAWLQAKDAPLTRFGAARRWRMIALVHGSLDASNKKLKVIYDDWWRRWRVEEYDPILDAQTQFERTNPVRYAAVIYSMQNIEAIFDVRNQLIAAVNGSALAAGLAAYSATYHVYPDDKEKLYGQFVRRLISDIDPFDEEYGPLRYRLLSERDSIETLDGRLWVEADQCILYARGQDHDDDRAAEHTDDGAAGDIVLWPPIRALSREQGLIE